MSNASNLFYGQSGGVTTVINSSAAGVITTARQHKAKINKVLAGRHGIIGLIKEELIDTSAETDGCISKLRGMPGGAFGSCRYKLPTLEQNPALYHRIIRVLEAHNIHYFLYNGGNDSADTTLKLANACQKLNYPLTCIGIPKTIDNDLPETDSCPGYGSVAKYIATVTKEAGVDLASMDEAIQVYIMTVMGRNSGWIAAASALAQDSDHHAPHIILLPEVPFDQKKFFAKVQEQVNERGHCLIVTANSLKDTQGNYVGKQTEPDAFGHYHFTQLAPTLCEMLTTEFGYTCHYAIPNFLQRCARHLSATVDLDQAYAMGEKAVELALAGENGVCPIIKRLSGKKYRWEIATTKLKNLALKEKLVPTSFISKDGFGVSKKFIDYATPLIQGEDFTQFHNGVPEHPQLKRILVYKLLPEFIVPPSAI